MPLEINISSPHRRSSTQTLFSSQTNSKISSRESEWESCSTLVQRHRFLLTALVLLGFLCTVYLYFAVTLGASNSPCSGLPGTEKALCHVEQAKAMAKGKLKFF